MEDKIRYDWPGLGEMEITIHGNTEAIARIGIDNTDVSKNSDISLNKETLKDHKQNNTENINKDFEAFRGILRTIHNKSTDRHSRNRIYQELSISYNRSLREGEFEMSVVYLMLMRRILIQEEAMQDAWTISNVARNIIDKKMIGL